MLEGCDNAGAFEYLKKLQKLMTMGPAGGMYFSYSCVLSN